MKSRAETEWPEFSFYRYELKLDPAINLKSGKMEKRIGMLVCCSTTGVTGWGDIAPLDGFSSETMAQVVTALPEIKRNAAVDRDISHPFPSVQCGLEFAMENWKAARENRSLYLRLGGVSEKTHLSVARLITAADAVSMVEQFRLAIKEGYGCVKLKVGVDNLDREIAMVRQLQSILPARVRLRLDGNRAWSLEEALAFTRGISSAGIEYIEEPLRDLKEYESYDREQNLAFALDESLGLIDRQRAASWRQLKAVVLKPTLLGGLSGTLDWMMWAKSCNLQAVISATFESGVGIRNLIALAAANAIDVTAGLDTYRYLAEDVVSPSLQYQRGRVAIYQTFAKSWELNFNRLEKIL